jgi:hypothetical protein
MNKNAAFVEQSSTIECSRQLLPHKRKWFIAMYLGISQQISLSLFLSFSLFLSLSLSLLCAMQLDQINHNFAILLQFFNFLVTSLNHRANACPCFHPRVPSICQRQKINKIDHQWPTKSAESPFSQIWKKGIELIWKRVNLIRLIRLHVLSALSAGAVRWQPRGS